MKYNYVFFNVPDSVWGAKDTGFYTITISDLKKLNNVHIVSKPLDYAPLWIQWIYRVHNSKKLNKLINFKYKKIWYPYWYKHNFCTTKPLCFIFCCGYEDLSYIKYLRNKYPHCRIVKLHRDLVDVFLKNGHEEFKGIYDGVDSSPYDLLYLFDKKEAKKYNGIYSPSIYFNSRLNFDLSRFHNECDAFFAGKVKDRWEKLIHLYNKLTKCGLKVNYYLVGVPSQNRILLPGITYANHNLSYKEILYRSLSSRCIIDINQKGTEGITQRFVEAIMYNKKLITDNYNIKNCKFYNDKFIKFVDEINESVVEFINGDVTVDFGYNNEFSPIRLIEELDNKLSELDDCEKRSK